MPDLALGSQVIGPDQKTRIDFGPVDELVDSDSARGPKRDLLEVFLRELDDWSFSIWQPLTIVLVRDLVTSVRIHLQVLDAMAGRPIELVERDLLALRSRRIQKRPEKRSVILSEVSVEVGNFGQFGRVLDFVGR